jgi:hypothetical protein
MSSAGSRPTRLSKWPRNGIDDELGRCLREIAEGPLGGPDPPISRPEVRHEVRRLLAT